MIKNLKTDFRGTFFHFHRLFTSRISCFIYSPLNLFIAQLKGVKLGKKNKFYGMTLFYRKSNSKISIGNNSTFRSDRRSNLIGLNHSCMISTLRENAEVKIGDYVGMSGTVIGAAEKVIIGNYTLCGANVVITDNDWHPTSPEARKAKKGGSLSKPVTIGENVWIGINCIILKGVTIGENSIIGANSVVVRDVPPNVIAAGNPCKIIKRL